MKTLLPVLALALLALVGCGLVQGAKDEAEQKKTDTTNMTPVEKFQVTAGHMLGGLAILVVGALSHGLVNAGTVKSLVTSLDSSVPADVHHAAVVALGVSSPPPAVGG